MGKDEKKILVEEGQILRKEQQIEEVLEGKEFKTLLENGEALKDLNSVRKRIIRRIAKHRFIFTLIVSTAIVLVWRGIWEISSIIPVLSQSIVALAIGLLILWLIERYSDLH